MPEALTARHGKYSGYEVTSEGEVFSVSSNWRGYGRRKMAQHINQDGYRYVNLTIDGRRKNFRVHNMMATCFLAQPAGSREVRHLDGVKLNNSLPNLAWGTAKENASDRDKHGRTAAGERNGFARLDANSVRRIIREYRQYGYQRSNSKALAREFGVSMKSIQNIVAGRQWATVGMEVGK